MAVDIIKMFFSDTFESAFDQFLRGFERLETLTTFVNVSTISFVSHISGGGCDLFKTVLALDGTCLKTGDTCLAKASTFTSNTVDMIPFPSHAPSVHVRIFCSKGKALITGCKSIVECVAALDDLCSATGMCNVDFTFPSCRLINANCSIGHPISLTRLITRLSTNPAVTFVDKPERQHRVVATISNGTKCQFYASGKFSVHGKCIDQVYTTINALEPVVHQAM